ncbi:DUF397 domain-containing protein [Streptomyces sp. NPDC050549]|uniref:DUF397 domain-containing protein n=1 Tax=Streptomyces sp. NPDC050549 TaxID=3155406 RepID=UPI00342B4F41
MNGAGVLGSVEPFSSGKRKPPPVSSLPSAPTPARPDRAHRWGGIGGVPPRWTHARQWQRRRESPTPSRFRRCRRRTRRCSCGNSCERSADDPPVPKWPPSSPAGAGSFKSSYSDGAGNNCVEVGDLSGTAYGGTAVHDSEVPREAARCSWDGPRSRRSFRASA